jgi:uncharacterized protein (TIGR00369 family)
MAAKRRELNGLQYLEALRRGEFPPAPIMVLMGITIVDVAEGRATFAMLPEEYHYNPMRIVHGGVAAALLDTTMGCALQSLVPAGRAYTTLDIQVRYVRPLTRQSGRVLCHGTAVHVGTRTATAEGRVVDEAGKLYATGTTSCMLIDMPTG